MTLTHSAKHKLLVSLVVFLCLLAAIVVLLPVAIQLGAQSWLRDQGLEADIEFVGFNLNNGTFTVENVHAKNPQGKGFVLEKLLVEINWKPIFDKVIDIQRVELTGLTLDARTDRDGLQVAGISTGGSSPDKVRPKPATENKPTEWAVQLQQLSLSAIRLCHETITEANASSLTTGQIMNSCASLKGLKWIGVISWQTPAKEQPVESGVKVKGNLEIDTVLLDSHQAKQTYASLGRASINNLVMNGLTQLSIDDIELADANFLQHRAMDKEPVPFLASWKLLSISDPVVNMDTSTASIGTIKLNDLALNVDRNKSGIAGVPVPSKEVAAAEAKELQGEKSPFNFSVENIVVNGNSQLLITDNVVDPVFKESLKNINIKLAQIDSTKPGVQSPLSVSFKVGEYGQLALNGSIQPFAPRLTFDLKQEIRNLDLANLNVYGKTFIGHRIQRGQMDLDQKLISNNGQLDTESKLVLQKFKIESLKGEEAEKYKSDLGIPLSTALSLLRDKDDSIRLSIPVTGDVDAPDFSINDIIAKVTSKAVKEAIISYYTPFGLVKIMSGVFNLATGLRFDPVVFVAGKAELDEQAIERMSKLSTLLSERPKIHLTLCGYPTLGDAIALYKPSELGLKKADEKGPIKLNEKQVAELLAILKARMDNMKKHMVEQLGVNPGQLILCSEPDNKQWITGIDSKPEIAVSL